MKTNFVNEMPTTGQFVMVNEHEGKVWGSTYRYNDEGKLEILDISVSLEDVEVDGNVVTVATPVDFWAEVGDFEEHTSDITFLGYVVEA